MTETDAVNELDATALQVAQRQQVCVAVGVLIDNAGRILIAKRAATAHQGGLWEFPGGKQEEDAEREGERKPQRSLSFCLRPGRQHGHGLAGRQREWWPGHQGYDHQPDDPVDGQEEAERPRQRADDFSGSGFRASLCITEDHLASIEPDMKPPGFEPIRVRF